MGTPNRPYESDLLLQKAIDGDQMTDRELRDLAAALIDSAELAEEFVEMRRIIAAAGALPKEGPSTGFVDRVMQAVARDPRPAMRFPHRLSWVGAVATALSLCAAALFVGEMPGAWRWISETAGWVRDQVGDSLWAPLQRGWSELATSWQSTEFGQPATLGVALGLVLLVSILNFSLARGMRDRT